MIFLPPPSRDCVLAFAGMLQAAALARQLARTPSYDADALHASAYSILRLHAKSPAEAFASSDGLRLGLQTLTKLFGGGDKADARELLRYAVGMHQLSLALARDRRTVLAIQDKLRDLGRAYLENRKDASHDAELFAEIGGLYAETLSRMSPRIILLGRAANLKNPLTLSRARTALFAGVRAAFLWRQLGGRRVQLLFQRKQYRELARQSAARAQD